MRTLWAFFVIFYVNLKFQNKKFLKIYLNGKLFRQNVWKGICYGEHKVNLNFSSQNMCSKPMCKFSFQFNCFNYVSTFSMLIIRHYLHIPQILVLNFFFIIQLAEIYHQDYFLKRIFSL